MHEGLLIAAATIYAHELKPGLTTEQRAILRFRACDEAIALQSTLESLKNVDMLEDVDLNIREYKENVQREHLADFLRQAGGNLLKASRLAGMSYKGFRMAAKRLGIYQPRRVI